MAVPDLTIEIDDKEKERLQIGYGPFSNLQSHYGCITKEDFEEQREAKRREDLRKDETIGVVKKMFAKINLLISKADTPHL